MELKLAKTQLVKEEEQGTTKAKKSTKAVAAKDAGVEKITLEEIVKKYNEQNEHFFYFDNSNTHKDMQKAKSTLEKSGLRTQLNEVRYGLDENNYIYEIYII